MKIMKKIAVAVFAGAMVFGLASCASGDDPENAIKGSGKKYSIDYTNEGSSIYRAFSKTALEHAGAAVKIDFLDVNADTKGAGVMGIIFDYYEKKDVKSFNVIGVKTTDANGNLGFYVSRFENVTDQQDENFGAWTKKDENGNVVEKGPAKETEYVKAFTKAQGVKDAENKVTVYAYVIEKKNTENDNWNYYVYLLNNTIAKLDSEGNLVDDAGKQVDLSSETPLATIPVYKDDGITLYENAKSPKQNRLAVYANIYPTEESGADPKKVTIGCGTLKGKWEYCGDYKEVGVDED